MRLLALVLQNNQTVIELNLCSTRIKAPGTQYLAERLLKKVIFHTTKLVTAVQYILRPYSKLTKLYPYLTLTATKVIYMEYNVV
ncbi:unnamed protein product [Adineta ricciae]|uniref:Uncharacterized protein n=1 Tax=Adineta ricciae TaxID=249248 RepID=A0A815NRQ7_ADIRI|nr:unnamed protein product [Adineta ricciae]